ncbi:MAG: hypothetical protein H0U72_02060 [Nitrosospira sp.]|nr:hypothetical protein [Nitrosospira sp.]
MFAPKIAQHHYTQGKNTWVFMKNSGNALPVPKKASRKRNKAIKPVSA